MDKSRDGKGSLGVEERRLEVEEWDGRVAESAPPVTDAAKGGIWSVPSMIPGLSLERCFKKK